MSIKQTIECWASCDPGNDNPSLVLSGSEPQLILDDQYYVVQCPWRVRLCHGEVSRLLGDEFLTPGACRARVTIELLDTD